MDTFLESAKPTNLNKREFDSLNRLITNKEIEIVIKILSLKWHLELKEFTAKFYQKLQLIPYKLFKTIEWEWALQICFYEANITLIARPGKDTTKYETTDQCLH